MTDVLVVIPCLNEEQHLKKLVLGLLFSPDTIPMRIVIADGGSTDKTLVIAWELAAKYPDVLVLHNPRHIQSAAINLAVHTYGEGADYLIRIDAHADYPQDYCKVLITEVQKTNAASVVVAMKTVGKEGFQKAVAAAQNSKLGNGGSSHRTAGGDGMWVDHGHHALMRIDAFRKISGYDEAFSHNEDAELDIRLGQAGFKIWLTGKTSLVYYPRSSPWPLFRQYKSYGAGRAATILKHRTRPKPRQLAPAFVLPALLLFLVSPASPAALPLSLWAMICVGYGVVLAIKEANPSIAMAGPAAMIMHMGWSIGFWGRLCDRRRNTG